MEQVLNAYSVNKAELLFIPRLLSLPFLNRDSRKHWLLLQHAKGGNEGGFYSGCQYTGRGQTGAAVSQSGFVRLFPQELLQIK